jgi:hypothetical protein
LNRSLLDTRRIIRHRRNGQRRGNNLEASCPEWVKAGHPAMLDLGIRFATLRRTQSDQLAVRSSVRLLEKLDFLWGGDSSKYAVAMRKAAKSVNNRLVSFRPLLQPRITEARHQCDRAGLPIATTEHQSNKILVAQTSCIQKNYIERPRASCRMMGGAPQHPLVALATGCRLRRHSARFTAQRSARLHQCATGLMPAA